MKPIDDRPLKPFSYQDHTRLKALCRSAFLSAGSVDQCQAVMTPAESGPCHNSAFELDGTRKPPTPSPRDMDPLTVDAQKLKEGEVWIEFVNYYPGKEHREEKPS